jgi:hypothetical protein
MGRKKVVKSSRWKEMLKLRVEINELDTKIIVQQITGGKKKRLVLWKKKTKNKMHKALSKLTKRNEKIQINKNQMKKGILQQTPMKFRGSCRRVVKT